MIIRSHFGIIQEQNTTEGMVNYQCLTDIFKLTPIMGITQSQRDAKGQRKLRATDERNYCNCAIHKYPLKYDSAGGQVNTMIPLRDYFVFAMLDNLVTPNIHEFVAERNISLKKSKNHDFH